ncbi:MAG TPA: hypothetical protein DD477_05210 [Spirochaetaceae bacterium]|nr:hypothetical protein [Spirochaetaceae bacterium]HBO40599.1 hypothetical protein [Spirochaetaceae bacterium]HCQ86056.1 hypothetical protein [Spirochaetaceae bacterium]
MNRKMMALALVVFIGAAFNAAAQQITRVAVVDLQKIYLTYYKDSQSVRAIEEDRLRNQQEIQRLSEEIRSLEAQRQALERSGDYEAARQLATQMIEKIQFLNDFTRIKQHELDERMRTLSETNTFVRTLYQTIQGVAEAEGYSLVLSSRNSDLVVLWFSSMVDITDKVIQELMEQ